MNRNPVRELSRQFAKQLFQPDTEYGGTEICRAIAETSANYQ